MPNKTENYSLNQWEPDDNFLRTDFNEDNAKVDAALASKPDIVLGKYNGQGAEKTINLGFTPRAVLVVMNGGLNQNYLDGCVAQLAFPGQAADCLEVVTNGFKVSGAMVNSGNYYNPFIYMAFK